MTKYFTPKIMFVKTWCYKIKLLSLNIKSSYCKSIIINLTPNVFSN